MFNLKSRRNKKSAFTLIELLVVILILGILIAVAIPLYLSSVRNAGSRTVQANIKTIAQASQAYRVKNGSYPALAADLQSAAGGDLEQPITNFGPNGVAYTIQPGGTPPTTLTVTATETGDKFGSAATGETLIYDLQTGLYSGTAVTNGGITQK